MFSVLFGRNWFEIGLFVFRSHICVCGCRGPVEESCCCFFFVALTCNWFDDSRFVLWFDVSTGCRFDRVRCDLLPGCFA